jgi:hypothetical protein
MGGRVSLQEMRYAEWATYFFIAGVKAKPRGQLHYGVYWECFMEKSALQSSKR